MTRPVIVKLGTESVVSSQREELRAEVLGNVARDVAMLQRLGKRFLIVSSGAITCGRNNPLVKKEGLNLDKQSLAAIGQPELFMAWKEAFHSLGILTGEFMFTHRLLTEASTKTAVTMTVKRFLNFGVPICNELDCATPEEIKKIVGGGDNDILTQHLATGLLPQRVIFLTGTKYVFNPVTQEPVITISARDTKFESLLIEKVGLGNGIASKVTAAMAIVRAISDCIVTIADYRTPSVISRIMRGEEEIGTNVIYQTAV